MARLGKRGEPGLSLQEAAEVEQSTEADIDDQSHPESACDDHSPPAILKVECPLFL